MYLPCIKASLYLLRINYPALSHPLVCSLSSFKPISKSSEFEARLFSRLNLIVVSLSCQRPSANLSED